MVELRDKNTADVQKLRDEKNEIQMSLVKGEGVIRGKDAEIERLQIRMRSLAQQKDSELGVLSEKEVVCFEHRITWNHMESHGITWNHMECGKRRID
jgi:hypothetical protein